MNSPLQSIKDTESESQEKTYQKARLIWKQGPPSQQKYALFLLEKAAQNHHPLSQIKYVKYLGAYLQDHKPTLSAEEKRKFYRNVSSFYETSFPFLSSSPDLKKRLKACELQYFYMQNLQVLAPKIPDIIPLQKALEESLSQLYMDTSSIIR